MITIKGYRRDDQSAENRVIKVTREIDDEIITLAEAKRHMQIDFADNDTLITDLISDARASLETYTQLSLVPCEVTAIIQNQISGMKLPWGPYVDGLVLKTEDGETIDTTDYTMRGDEIYQYTHEIFTATYNAGYDEDTLPRDLRRAILCQVSYLYEHRGDKKDSIGMSPEAKKLAGPSKTQSWIA